MIEKAKVEKLVKTKIERQVEASTGIDNKSALRAIARLEAVKELYPSLAQEDSFKELFDVFYKEAKWQDSWDPHFAKAGQDAQQFAEYLKMSLGRPTPRPKRIKPDMVSVTPPATEDPDAILQQDTGT